MRPARIFDALPERDRPRYQLAATFQTFELQDRDERPETRFASQTCRSTSRTFGFMFGVQRRTFRDWDPVTIETSVLVASCTTRSRRPVTTEAL